MILKPFNLARAIAGDPLVTRDGRKVMEFHRFNDAETNQKCFAVVDKKINGYSDDGYYHRDSGSGLDLFMASVVKKYYANVYKYDCAIKLRIGSMFETIEEAKTHSLLENFIKTIEIEIEE